MSELTTLEMLDARLQPCPFCGSGAQVDEGINVLTGDPNGYYEVRCMNRECKERWATASEAAEHWNRRSHAVLQSIQTSIIRAFVERVEKQFWETERDADMWFKAYHRAIHDELAALEAEVKE